MSKNQWCCSYEEIIEEQPVLPKTKKKARDRGLSLNDYLKDHEVVDKTVCPVMGHICPRKKNVCDLATDFTGVEKRIVSFLNEFKDQDNVVHYFLGLLCGTLKSMVSDLSDDDARTLLLTERHPWVNFVMTEISKRRGEIVDWKLSPTADRFMLMAVHLRNVREFPTMKFVVGGLNDGRTVEEELPPSGGQTPEVYDV